MAPSGKCRICGGPSVDTMPCYTCTILMMDVHDKWREPEQRHDAFKELDNRFVGGDYGRR